MYYRLILYYYTHCTFEQMGVQAICSDEHRFCSAEQMAQKREHRCSRTSIDGHYNIVFLSLHISSSVTDTTLRPSSSKTFLQNERSAT